MNDNNTSPKRASLLGLPRELRDEIFRYVHLDDQPFCHMWGMPSAWIENGLEVDRSGTAPFPQHALLISRQLYDEASAVLYSENTFGLWIYSICAQEQCRPWPEDCKMDWWKEAYPVMKVRKLHITFSLDDNHLAGAWDDVAWYRRIEGSMREVALALAQSPALQRLTIQVRAYGVPAAKVRTVLQPFKMLRNLRFVTFEDPPAEVTQLLPKCRGAPPDYALYLKGLMERPLPLEYLPRMHRGLQVFASRPTWSWKEPLDLTDAYKAAEAGDNEQFRVARRKVIGQVRWARKASDLACLFAHDKIPPWHPVQEED